MIRYVKVFSVVFMLLAASCTGAIKYMRAACI